MATISGANDDSQRTISAQHRHPGRHGQGNQSNGMLKLTNIGGLGWANVEGGNCIIITSSGAECTGTLSSSTEASAHVHGSETATAERKADTMQVRLDERVKSAEDNSQSLGIEVGDSCGLCSPHRRHPQRLHPSRHLDDKADVAIVLGVIKAHRRRKVRFAHTHTNFFFSHFEEVGTVPAPASPRHQRTALHRHGRPGEGQQSDGVLQRLHLPQGLLRPTGRALKEKLVKKLGLRRHDIPYQVDIYPFYGSDASSLAAGRLRFHYRPHRPQGVDASHSHERTHKDSIMATANLTWPLCPVSIGKGPPPMREGGPFAFFTVFPPRPVSSLQSCRLL